ENNWIALKLVGSRSNRAAIGARIRLDVRDSSGPRSIYRWVSSGGSLGANPLMQHIGIGRAERIERIEVYWPASDTRQEFDEVAVNQRLRVVEGRKTLEPLVDEQSAVGQ